MKQSHITWGTYLPSQILTNNDLENHHIVFPSGKILTADQVTEKIGVKKRHIAKKSVAQMCCIAAKKALGKKMNIDVIVCSTSHPTSYHLATTVREKLGLQKSVEVMDVHAACSGSARMFAYLYENRKRLNGKKILLCAADTMSPSLVDLRRSDAFDLDPSLGQTIFGDGGAAVSFTLGEDVTIEYATYSPLPIISEKKDIIRMAMGNNTFVEPCITFPVARSLTHPDFPNGYFTQEGPLVYLTVSKAVPSLIREAVAKAKYKASDIKMVIIHPGSKRMVDGLSELLPEYKVYADYKDANMSSVSLLYSFILAMKKGFVRKGDVVVLSGFGAGSPSLFSSTVVLKLG